MKKVLFILAIAFVAVSFNNPVNPDGNKFKVDVKTSTIKWKGYKPTGSHNGTISLSQGLFEMDGDQIKSGSFLIDMNSIVVSDMPADSEYNTKLVNHLKSKDFFEVEVFGTSKFEIVNVSYKDGSSIVTGKLTIKDVTKQISIPAKISVEADQITLETETFQINRADFNIKYKSKSFFNNLKEKFINDKFDLQVKIVAKK